MSRAPESNEETTSLGKIGRLSTVDDCIPSAQHWLFPFAQLSLCVEIEAKHNGLLLHPSGNVISKLDRHNCNWDCDGLKQG